MRDAKCGVDEFFCLFFDRIDNFRVRMAHIEHANTADEIDVAFAFYIPQLSPFRFGGVNAGLRRQADRASKVTPGFKAFIGSKLVFSVIHRG